MITMKNIKKKGKRKQRVEKIEFGKEYDTSKYKIEILFRDKDGEPLMVIQS